MGKRSRKKKVENLLEIQEREGRRSERREGRRKGREEGRKKGERKGEEGEQAVYF